MSTLLDVPLKESAPPLRPAVAQVAPDTVPLFPLPERSLRTVPVPSLNPYAPTNPGTPDDDGPDTERMMGVPAVAALVKSAVHAAVPPELSVVGKHANDVKLGKIVSKEIRVVRDELLRVAVMVTEAAADVREPLFTEKLAREAPAGTTTEAGTFKLLLLSESDIVVAAVTVCDSTRVQSALEFGPSTVGVQLKELMFVAGLPSEI